MARRGLLVLLLQGVLITAIAETTTSIPSLDQENNQTEESTKLPLYKVNSESGEPCILVEMDAFVSVSWDISSNKSFQMDMNLQPRKVETNGSCGKDEIYISLSWESFHLQWNFSKTRDSTKWFAKKVELQFNKSALDHQSNDIEGLSTVSSGGASEVLLFSARLGEAYHCPSEYELQLTGSGGDRAALTLRQLRLQPFAEKGDFGPEYCPSRTTSSSAMSPTVSSNSFDSAVTKSPQASSSTEDDTGHSNFASSIVQNPTPVPEPSPISTRKAVQSQSTTANSHSPYLSAMPFREFTKTSGVPYSTSFSPSSATTPSPKSPELTPTVPSLASLPPYIYQKTLPNVVKMSFYPPKKVFFSGVKLDNNEALPAMLWSWYTSGFYTGYYQALQQSNKVYKQL